MTQANMQDFGPQNPGLTDVQQRLEDLAEALTKVDERLEVIYAAITLLDALAHTTPSKAPAPPQRSNDQILNLLTSVLGGPGSAGGNNGGNI